MCSPIILCNNCNAVFTEHSKPVAEVLPDFSSHLRFGVSLSQYDLDIIQDQISATEATISLISSEICNLRSRAVALQECKIEIISRNLTYRALQSSILKLPSEVLVSIFEQCINVEVKLRPMDVSFPHDSICGAVTIKETASSANPLNISRVCRRWRDVSLALPHLWSTIDMGWVPFGHVNMHHSRTKQLLDIDLARNSAALFLTFVKYAGHCPLTVSVSSVYQPGFINPVMSVLAENSDKIKNLYLDIFPEHYGAKGELEGVNFPRVERLTLQHAMGFSSNDDLTVFLNRERFPILRSASLEHLENRIRLSKRIEELTLNNTYIEDFSSRFLSRHRSLTSLTVIDPILRCNDLTWCHDSITSLTFSGGDTHGFFGAVMHNRFEVSFPNLTSLKLLDDDWGFSIDIQDESTTFFDSCKLQDLYLGDVYIDTPGLIQIFQYIPHLRSLEIRPTCSKTFRARKKLFEILSMQPLLLPNLRSLTTPTFKHPISVIRAMLQERASALSPLSSLMLIDVPDTINFEEMRELQKCDGTVVIFNRK